MRQLKSSSAHLRQLFERAITLRDIAEPLASFDSDHPAVSARQFMDKQGYDVVGIRQCGVMVGYVVRNDLNDGPIGASCKKFSSDAVKLDTDPLVAVFQALEHSRHVFVSVLGQVGAIVTRGDLQKAPVRLWLFGLISLTEMQMLRVIRDRYPADPWKVVLSPERVTAAQRIFEARRKRNEENQLSDCLQFCDKATILAKDEELRSSLGFESKTSCDRFFQKVQTLRDALAHSNDILGGDWTELVTLVNRLESTLLCLEKLAVPPFAYGIQRAGQDSPQ